jgi:uncharacterized protein
MDTEILKALHDIELKEKIHILLASEVGSHAWGYASKTSDFDVRFIYVYPPIQYLEIDNPKEGVDLLIKDQLDLRGWELRKTLRFFRKSNPSLFEALHSPVIYRKDEAFFNWMKQLEPAAFSKRTCFSHYFHMARQNIKTWEMTENPPIKLLFHCLRPILMCKWLEENPSLPPLSLPELLAPLPQSIDQIFGALNVKRQVQGDRIEKTDPLVLDLHGFVSEQFKALEQNRLKEEEMTRKKVVRSEPPNETFNHLFRQVLRATFPTSF